jgi:2-hydroxychromene-2-carboxylate isomerase
MIEFFFGSSPWTYLAFHNIQPMAAELGVPIAWRPILVGGIFNTVNPSVYASRENPVPAKAAYMREDLADWARAAGLKIVFPPRVFPVISVKVMRACLLLEADGKLTAFARAVFEAYWGNDEDISQDEVLARVASRAGVDPAYLFAGLGEQAVKDKLRTNTEELMRRGGFGSPTMFVGGVDMFFGNDRLALVRAAVERSRKRTAAE